MAVTAAVAAVQHNLKRFISQETGRDTDRGIG